MFYPTASTHIDPLFEPNERYLPSSEKPIVEISKTDLTSADAKPVPISNIRMVVLSISFS
jgi:hypothetical protein